MHSKDLSVDQIDLVYGVGAASVHALSDISLSFERGTVTLITGPSGSGKTSLLSVLGCLLKPKRGDVFVAGENVRHWSEDQRTVVRRKHIGFVFQAFRLFKALSAIENVLIATDITGQHGQQRYKVARGRLCELGLSSKLHLKPSALSGGEKQRVAIARALANDPLIILADEPTASLDSGSGHKVGEILLELAEQENRIVVIVSHDPRLTKFSHRLIEMQDGVVVRTARLQ